jgi:hypothetical protein
VPRKQSSVFDFCFYVRVQEWHKREHNRRMIEEQKAMLQLNMGNSDESPRTHVFLFVCMCVRKVSYVCM